MVMGFRDETGKTVPMQMAVEGEAPHQETEIQLRPGE